jgi:hypothetical protein
MMIFESFFLPRICASFFLGLAAAQIASLNRVGLGFDEGKSVE